jgi:hypothetical protein
MKRPLLLLLLLVIWLVHQHRQQQHLVFGTPIQIKHRHCCHLDP